MEEDRYDRRNGLLEKSCDCWQFCCHKMGSMVEILNQSKRAAAVQRPACVPAQGVYFFFLAGADFAAAAGAALAGADSL
jgi:hypothetical protein